MKYIRVPVKAFEDGRFCDLDNDNIEFEAVRISDQEEEICLVPTDLKPNAERIVAEIIAALNERDKLRTQFTHLHGALSYVRRVLREKAGSEYGLDVFEVDRCLRKLDAALAKVRGGIGG